MATYISGGVNRATANSKAAARRSAASRQCPECGRKSALQTVSLRDWFGSACRWCGWEHRIDRVPTAVADKDAPTVGSELIHLHHSIDGYPLCWGQDRYGESKGTSDESEVTCPDCREALSPGSPPTDALPGETEQEGR